MHRRFFMKIVGLLPSLASAKEEVIQQSTQSPITSVTISGNVVGNKQFIEGLTGAVHRTYLKGGRLV